ncbi:hypothetical protein VTI74DRAFT_2031 [Chaetomium olivicolor]
MNESLFIKSKPLMPVRMTRLPKKCFSAPSNMLVENKTGHSLDNGEHTGVNKAAAAKLAAKFKDIPPDDPIPYPADFPTPDPAISRIRNKTTVSPDLFKPTTVATNSKYGPEFRSLPIDIPPREKPARAFSPPRVNKDPNNPTFKSKLLNPHCPYPTYQHKEPPYDYKCPCKVCGNCKYETALPGVCSMCDLNCVERSMF